MYEALKAEKVWMDGDIIRKFKLAKVSGLATGQQTVIPRADVPHLELGLDEGASGSRPGAMVRIQP